MAKSLRSGSSAAPTTSPRPRSRPDAAQEGSSNAVNQANLTQTQQAEGSGWFQCMVNGTADLQLVVDNVIAAVPELVAAADEAEALQAATDHVPAILDRALARGVALDTQVAYILATAWHESRFGMTRYGRSEALVEDHNPYRRTDDGLQATNHVSGRQVTGDGARDMDENYWDDAYGGRLGNERGTSDAADFRGRGLVQLTGRVNYERMTRELRAEGYSYTHEGVTYGGEGNAAIDLVKHFTHVNEVPDLAARILVDGSMDGQFTGKALPDYVDEDQTDFESARAVINGDKATNGAKIADEARHFLAALQVAPGWTSLVSPTP